MFAAQLFPGVAFLPLPTAAKAIGLSAKTLKNQFYAGRNALGIIKLGGRLVVPAENFDAFARAIYATHGMSHLCSDATAAVETPSPTTVRAEPRRPRGRPRKLPPSRTQKGGPR